MEPIVWLMIALGVGFLVYLVYTGQFKWLLGVIRNMTVGIVGILLANMVASSFGFAVGINAITALTVGLLGAPGFLLLYATRVLVG